MIGGLCFHAVIFFPSGEKKSSKNQIQFFVIFSFREKQCKNAKFSEMNNATIFSVKWKAIVRWERVGTTPPVRKEEASKIGIKRDFRKCEATEYRKR